LKSVTKVACIQPTEQRLQKKPLPIFYSDGGERTRKKNEVLETEGSLFAKRSVKVWGGFWQIAALWCNRWSKKWIRKKKKKPGIKGDLAISSAENLLNLQSLMGIFSSRPSNHHNQPPQPPHNTGPLFHILLGFFVELVWK